MNDLNFCSINTDNPINRAETASNLLVESISKANGKFFCLNLLSRSHHEYVIYVFDIDLEDELEKNINGKKGFCLYIFSSVSLPLDLYVDCIIKPMT